MNLTLFKHEMKLNLKSLIIWTLSVGLICFGCILLYTGLESSVKEMADSFSDLGAMSAALGMDKMSLATLNGYYATEIALMHSLGDAMFASVLGTGILSKEEASHTSEFLNTFPFRRGCIVFQKYLALICNILLFNLICTGLYLSGFGLMGETINGKSMAVFHFAVCFMQIEIGSVCFMISAFAKKSLPGTGIGISFILFAMDMMCRILPSLESLKYVTPFYYSNASDIFYSGKTDSKMLLIGIGVTFLSFAAAFVQYQYKDLAA